MKRKQSMKCGVAALVILPFIAAGSQAYATSAVAPSFNTTPDTVSADAIAGFPTVTQPIQLASANPPKCSKHKHVVSRVTGKGNKSRITYKCVKN
jgi:hypothetical protein